MLNLNIISGKFDQNTNKLLAGLSLIFYLILYPIDVFSASDKGQPSQLEQSAYRKADNQVKSEIEQQQKQAQKEIEHSIVQDAVEVISETKKAITAIDKNEEKEALTAIESATGKVSILLGEYGKEAILPVDFYILVIDVAPYDMKNIKMINKLVEGEMFNHHYPEARLLLNSLRSELNIQIYSLPLPFYAEVLKDAGGLLHEKKLKEAKKVLQMGLTTLASVYKVIPIPILNAKALIFIAEKHIEKDENTALKILDNARHELLRAKALGYSGLSEEYPALLKEIEEVSRQLKGDKKSISHVFSRLKNSMDAFLNGLSREKIQPVQKSSDTKAKD